MASSHDNQLDEGLLDEDSVNRKAEVFIRMLECGEGNSESVDIENTEFIVSHDVNGVWISTDGSGEGLKQGAHEALEEVNLGSTHLETFTSGNPVEYLRKLKESEMGGQNLGLIGELGTVYENGDGINFVHPDEDPLKLFEITQRLYNKAADQEVKLMPQNDVSNVKLCFRPEAENRSGLGEEVKNQMIEDIAAELEDYSEFEYDSDSGRIIFENSMKNAAILTDTLRYNFRFPGIRFEEAEGKIAFYRDSEDNEDMSLEEAHEFIVGELPEDVEYYKNDDYGVDIVTVEDASKQAGLEAFRRRYAREGDEIVYTHSGDKTSDVFTGEEVYLFPIEDSEAHDYCLKQGIPHIPVEDGAEYARIMGAVADRK